MYFLDPDSYSLIILEESLRQGFEMAQFSKVPAAQPDDMSSISGAHAVEGEN